MDDAQLLSLLDQVIRTMPDSTNIYGLSPETLEWFGRGRAILQRWNPVRAVRFSAAADNLRSLGGYSHDAAFAEIVSILHEARMELQMRTVGQSEIVVDSGHPFDYYDEVRRVIERAAVDIFIIDPYIGADFVPKYLAHVRRGVKIRLLTRQQLTQLVPSADQFAKQHGSSIEIRRSKSHDRYDFIDGTDCYHSSASFQDGGRKSAAMLSQVTDAFESTKQIYEAEWSAADVARAPEKPRSPPFFVVELIRWVDPIRRGGNRNGIFRDANGTRSRERRIETHSKALCEWARFSRCSVGTKSSRQSS